MHEPEETELKVEIEQISQRIESILKKVEEITPTLTKEEEEHES